MEELELVNDNKLVKPESVLEIYELNNTIEELTAKRDELKKKIFDVMLKNNVISIDNDIVQIELYRNPEKEFFNRKLFREECPELYDEYTEIKKIKPHIKMKFKKGANNVED